MKGRSRSHFSCSFWFRRGLPSSDANADPRHLYSRSFWSVLESFNVLPSTAHISTLSPSFSLLMMKGFQISTSLLIILIALIYLEQRSPLETTNVLSAKVLQLKV